MRVPMRLLRSAGPVAAPAAVGGLATLLWFDGGVSPETYLMLAAALCAALASVPRPWLRWTAQAAVLGLVTNALASAGRPTRDVVFVVALLVTTAALAGTFVRRMRTARLAALRAGEEATSRAELLDAVRDLPGSSAEEAAGVVCRALRSLGFDGAGVVLLEGGALEPIHAEGHPSRMVSSSNGPAWEAIGRDGTVVRPEGSLVTVVGPIRVDGDPIGAVAGIWSQPQVPGDADIAVVEVLASHLGGVLAAERRIARQTELLGRLEILDRMRGELLGAVSDEIRDPLTILRGAGQILASHADRISEEQRLAFLERMCAQAADLGVVIDVLLDFSRSQSQRHDPVVRPISLLDLLHPLRHVSPSDPATGPDRLADVTVLADASLVRSGMELLIDLRSQEAASDGLEIVDADGHAELRIALTPEGPMSELVRSLVSQLLEAGGARMDVDERVVVRLDHAPVSTALPSGDAQVHGDDAS